MNTVVLVLPILTVLMFDLGLTLQGGDFSLVFKKPAVIGVALFGQIIVLPLVAFCIGAAFRLEPVYLIGLVLIGCCPGGSSSNLFSRVAGAYVGIILSTIKRRAKA